RMVPVDAAADFRRQAAFLKRVQVSDADLSSLYRFGDGGLSPLSGPMNKAMFDRVLEEEVVGVNAQKYAWTIPISFPLDKGQAGGLKVGETVALTNSKNEIVGTLTINDIFAFDKPRYIQGVYGTTRLDHPGGNMVMSDPREMLLGGEVRVLPQPKHP